MGDFKGDPDSIRVDESMAQASVEFALQQPGVFPLSLVTLQRRVGVLLGGLAFRRWLNREDMPYSLVEFAPITFPEHTVPVLQGHACHISVASCTLSASTGFWPHPRDLPAQPHSFALFPSADANALHICMLLCRDSQDASPASLPRGGWLALPPRTLQRAARRLHQPFLRSSLDRPVDMQFCAETGLGKARLGFISLAPGETASLPADIRRIRYLRPGCKPGGILHVGETHGRIVWTIPAAGWKNIWPSFTAAFFVGWITQKAVGRQSSTQTSPCPRPSAQAESITQASLSTPADLIRLFRQG